jgi:Ca2+-binding EF-hand superfamily protein
MNRTAFIIWCAFAVTGCQETPRQPSGQAVPKPQPPVWRHTLPSNPIPSVLEQYDADHDGLLGITEKQAIKAQIAERRRWQREEILGQYDSNHDGKIEGAEKEALRRDRDEVRAQVHAIALRKYDANRNGVLDTEERATMARDNAAFLAEIQSQALAKYDTNANGTLEPNERTAIRAAAHRKWAPRR